MLINLPIHNVKILAKRPVLDQLGPVKTKTGLKTEKDCGLRSFAVQSSLFRFWDEGRLVSVSVHALRAKKPDQTGLSSTNHVPLLESGVNFPKWKRFIIQVLQAEGYWMHIEGTDGAFNIFPKSPEPATCTK